VSAPKSRIRVWTEIALAVLVLAAVFVWSESLLSDKVGPASRAEASVSERHAGQTVPAREVELPVEVELTGTIRPAREATVAARIQGTVRSLAVDEGDRVEEGRLLVSLEAEELQSRAGAAGRQVAAARARLEQATRDVERARALAAKRAATRVEVERAETALELATASLAAARQAAGGERTVAAYTSIRAPFSGRVVERLVEPGDLAHPGRPLLRLETDGGFRLEVPVDESLAAGLTLGEPVAVKLEAAGRTLDGLIGEIDPAADSGSRTVLVKLDLPGEPGLRSGSFGRAVFSTGSRTAVVAPAAAIRRIGGLSTLRVVVDERVVTRHVRVGASLDGEMVEILSGLKAGDRIALGETQR
jgi:RND family efflux transporter MFP subunit